jgi:hypothetical protein
MPPRILAAAALALAGGLTTLTFSASAPANAQAEFTLSAEQLRINQRIAQAAVRRSNEALTRLDALVATPGPQGPAGPQGAKGEAAPAGVLRLVAFARVDRPRLPNEPLPPMPAYAEGYVPPVTSLGVTHTSWPQPGVAWVVVKEPLVDCAYSATIRGGEDGLIRTAADLSSALPNSVQVETSTPDGTPTSRSFDLLVFCR